MGVGLSHVGLGTSQMGMGTSQMGVGFSHDGVWVLAKRGGQFSLDRASSYLSGVLCRRAAS
jgi:hypothetical protein